MPRVKELLGGRSNLDLRNYIINGAFDYWQRGTSFALNTTTYHTDRFFGAVNADGGTAATGTVSRQSLGVGLTGVEDQEYYLRINNTTVGSSLGNNSFYVLGQRIEDVRTLSGKTITVSIWMAASTAKQVALYAAQIFGVGGSTQVNMNCSSNGIKTLTSNVTRYDFTVTVPSILGKTVGTSSYLEIGLFFQAGSTQMSAYGYPAASLGWGAAGNIDIVRFQVTEGDVVGVPFSRSGGDLGGELSRCLRYFEKFTHRVHVTTISDSSSGTDGFGVFSYSYKRSIPVITVSGTWRTLGANNGGAVSLVSGSFAEISNNRCAISVPFTPGTGLSAYIQSDDTATGSIEINSEL